MVGPAAGEGEGVVGRVGPAAGEGGGGGCSGYDGLNGLHSMSRVSSTHLCILELESVQLKQVRARVCVPDFIAK